VLPVLFDRDAYQHPPTGKLGSVPAPQTSALGSSTATEQTLDPSTSNVHFDTAQSNASTTSGSGNSPVRYMPIQRSLSNMSIDASIISSGLQSTGCGAPNGCGNLTYHNGPVMHNPVNFLIFWLPSGYSFDNPTIDSQSVGASDAGYEQLMVQFFLDICQPNSFYSLIQQYRDTNNGIGSCSLGGYWIDNSNYPGGRGTQTNPLTDADIQNEISAAVLAKGWSSNNGNNEFFVFTGYGVVSWDSNFACAYHSFFTSSDGSKIIYANMHDTGTVCSVSYSPNNDLFADSVISTISHELFESFTDPLGTGWFYRDGQHEIGDECNFVFGTRGSTLHVGGDYYRIQLEWSNSANGCQGFIPPPAGLFGQYWQNSFFGAPLSSCTTYNSPIPPTSGPTVTETDPNIGYGVATGWNWHPRNFNEFSVKWTGSISTPIAGTYAFKLASDDGSWLYINSASMINHGGQHSSTDPPGTAIVSLSQGVHQIEVDYYETCSSTSAGIDLSWTPPNTSSSLIIPTYLLNPPIGLDGRGLPETCVSGTCQLLSTNSAPDVILAIAECQNPSTSTLCDSITPSIQDTSGLQFTLHKSYCYVGTTFDSCLWEYYSIANYALSNDNITLASIPGLRGFITFALSSANTISIFDPGLPADQHCGALDGSPANCTVNFTISPSPASGPYEFLAANTAINDAPPCNATFAPGWTQMNNGNVEADYRVIINSQRSYSFTCDKYADPVILMADGVQSQGPDFKISTSSTIVTTYAGLSASIPIALTPLNTFAGTVNLSITESPSAGITCTLSPLSLSLSVAQNSTLSCSGSGGTYGINITGLTGSLSHSLLMTFRSQDFVLSANPVQIFNVVSSNSSSTLSLSGLGGLSGNVSLSASISSSVLIGGGQGGAGGGRALEMVPMSSSPLLSLNRTSIQVQGSNPQTCLLIVYVPFGVAAGNYTIVVSALGANLSHSTNLLLVVSDFSLTPAPDTLKLAPGGNTTSTVILGGLNGFQGNITVTLSLSPSGPTASISPSLLFLSKGTSNNVTLSITASPSTPIGNYTLTIVGSSGTLSHSLVVIVTVQSGASENAFVSSLIGQSSFSVLLLGAIGIVALIPKVRIKTRSTQPTRLTRPLRKTRENRCLGTFHLTGFGGICIGPSCPSAHHESNY
jgi:hypothetical protein